jgi:threonine dehydrogenase-like Zn-dependent dehydrogenase
MSAATMRAVVFKGPLKVALEDRPIPKIEDPKDIVVKVEYSALCGRYLMALLMSNFDMQGQG